MSRTSFIFDKSSNGGTSTPVSDNNVESLSLLARAERAIQNNQQTNSVIQELVYRYDYLSQQYQQVHDAYKRDSEGLRNWKLEKRHLESQLETLRICLEKDPFVIVLIDGDGMIFEDDLIKAGESGGRKAAALLQTAVIDYIERELKRSTLGLKIVCRAYANVRGLGEVLVRTGIIADTETIEQFTRGFTRCKTLFDFVDVGPGKDRADEKIIETFKLYMSDFHCQQIFFGCSHDNGYARILEEHATDRVYLERVTLLEGVPFEKELRGLPYPTKKFPAIFRDSKVNMWGASNGAPKVYNIGNGTAASPIPAHVVPDMQRSVSNSTLASNDSRTIPGSWAARAAAAVPTPSPDAQINRILAKSQDVISRNRAGQRVDPICCHYDKAEVDRIKKMKMCNVHFLRNECPYGDNCTHIHKYKPTKEELGTLRLVARMAPCIHGGGCADEKCIYGHRCPAPRGKNPIKGTKSCIFGEQCKFPPELHDIDTNIVKTLLTGSINDLIGLQL